MAVAGASGRLRRALLRAFAVVGLAALAPVNVAFAQYPDRPIKLILPFPGGEGEAVARLIAPSLGQHLGQPVVVESKPGAAGNIAAGFVSRAPADGYTLLMGFSTIFEINPLLYRNLGFDPAQLAPVSLVAETQFVLVVNPSVPARTVQELIAYAKANPGKLNFASAGVGSPLHLAGELFQSRAGVKFLHVPYKGGGEAASAVLGGHADLLFGTISTSMANVQAGRLRALGVTGERRFAAYADLPTIAESGVPGYNVTAWHSLALPAGTPPDLVARINDAVVKTLAEPEVRQGLERAGVIPGATTPAEVSRRIDTESKLWKSVMQQAGIQPE